MCGICGILSLNGGLVEPAIITSMRDTMLHRGPDDAGVWCDGRIGLGHRRLSIIDLSPAAHQPMFDDQGGCGIVFNGEIYNYRELRMTLAQSGKTFRSNSDTEVILQAYCHWGDACITKLDGIFAFALWDQAVHRLLLARDRLGVKPIYYTVRDGRFAFSSEVKALLAWCPELCQLREDVLEEYLTFRDVAGRMTLLRDVYRLLPGHKMVVQDGLLEEECYWKIPIGTVQGQDGPDDLQQVDDVLRKTIWSQMVSDVPVGTLCSGGIDSSLVTALAQKYVDTPLHTFSVSFPGYPCDESYYATKVASHLGTVHHQLDANADSFADDLPRLTRIHDEPLSHENSVLIYQVCRLAREQGVIVLLTGEGADELFAGYGQVLLANQLSKYRHWQTLPFRSFWTHWGGGLSTSRFVRWANNLSCTEDDLVLYATAYMAPHFVQRLLGHKAHGNFDYRRMIVKQTGGLSLSERVRWMDLAIYLAPILLRQDKMSMACSVESRVPMLGDGLVAWACRQPFSSLMVHGLGKLPLRRIARQILPAEIVDRPKVGFGLPMGAWMRSSTKLLELLQILAEPSSRIGLYIDRTFVRQLLDLHRSGKADHSKALWILLSLEIWMREVLYAYPTGTRST